MQENNHCLLNSPAFSALESRYGNYRITLPINRLLELYEQSIGKYEMGLLWTYIYSREYEHTILIHPGNMSSQLETLQKVEDYIKAAEYPVVTIGRESKKWCWRPQSTSITNHHRKLKSWDNLTFAFLIPDGCGGLDIPDEDLIDKATIHEPRRTSIPSSGRSFGNWNEAYRNLMHEAEMKLSREKFKKLKERMNQVQVAGPRAFPTKRRRDEYPKQESTVRIVPHGSSKKRPSTSTMSIPPSKKDQQEAWPNG